MEQLLRIASLLAKLATARRLVELAIVAGSVLLCDVARRPVGSLWELVGVAPVVLGALIGAHVLVALLAEDDNDWDSASTRSIDLPLAAAEAASHVQHVLAGGHEAYDVQREGLTITCRVGARHPQAAVGA